MKEGEKEERSFSFLFSSCCCSGVFVCFSFSYISLMSNGLFYFAVVVVVVVCLMVVVILLFLTCSRSSFSSSFLFF